jgi:NTP pyrophosphatase (non-canonical NTP hydrolase)
MWFGVERQLQKCCEEMAEAIVAIHHWKDGKCTEQELASEIADVMIMCNQMKLVLSHGLVDAKKTEKLERLENRMK